MTKEPAEKKISRRKVLKGLEACKFGPKYPIGGEINCSPKHCPYYKSKTCDMDLFEDAIALIKQDEDELKEFRKKVS